QAAAAAPVRDGMRLAKIPIRRYVRADRALFRSRHVQLRVFQPFFTDRDDRWPARTSMEGCLEPGEPGWMELVWRFPDIFRIHDPDRHHHDRHPTALLAALECGLWVCVLGHFSALYFP